MDIRKIKKLIEIIEDSDIAELEIHEGEESVRINRYSTTVAPVAPPVVAEGRERHTQDARCHRRDHPPRQR